MSELEQGMRIVNRDQKTLISIYENISSQLAGIPVTVVPRETEKPKTEEPIEETKNSSWFKFKK